MPENTNTLLRLESRGIAAAGGDDLPRIDRDGGDYGAGIIRGYSVATIGEALGHNAYLDDTTIDQIVDLGRAAPTGIKSRFAHENLSEDGMGKQIGRAKNFRRDGNVARADLHFYKSARKAPQGDLAGFVMDLGEEDPDSFGTSVVIKHDLEFRLNEDGTPQRDAAGKQLSPLIRVTSLRAIDVVDEPAANDGLFSRDLPDAPARLATQFLDRAFGGLTDEQLQVKVNVFLKRYLSHRNKDQDMNELTAAADNPNDSDLTLLTAHSDRPTNASVDPVDLEQRGRMAERGRVNKIRALCNLAGCPDKAGTFIDGDFSVVETQTALSEILDKRNQTLALEAADDNQETKPDENQTFLDEYRANTNHHSFMGVTEDMYVLSRRVDEGLEQLIAGSAA